MGLWWGMSLLQVSSILEAYVDVMGNVRMNSWIWGCIHCTFWDTSIAMVSGLNWVDHVLPPCPHSWRNLISHKENCVKLAATAESPPVGSERSLNRAKNTWVDFQHCMINEDPPFQLGWFFICFSHTTFEITRQTRGCQQLASASEPWYPGQCYCLRRSTPTSGPHCSEKCRLFLNCGWDTLATFYYLLRIAFFGIL